MSKNIYNVKLIDLLTENLRADPDIIAASKATDQEFQLMAQNIRNCLTIADIDNVSENVLDHLAAEMNTEFYSQELPIENRRDMVKNSYTYQFLKGTKYVVEQLLTDAFDDSTLEEWFEYGGQPYYFKITTTDRTIDESVLGELINAINTVKNVRSWLEGINVHRQNTGNIYLGFANRQCNFNELNYKKYTGYICSLPGVIYNTE